MRWVVPKQTPVGAFLAIAIDGVAAHLDVFERADDGKWNLGFTVPMTKPTRRSFDLEYETTTKSLLAVYGDATAAPKYRRRTASGWSTAAPRLTCVTSRARSTGPSVK